MEQIHCHRSLHVDELGGIGKRLADCLIPALSANFALKVRMRFATSVARVATSVTAIPVAGAADAGLRYSRSCLLRRTAGDSRQEDEACGQSDGRLSQQPAKGF